MQAVARGAGDCESSKHAWPACRSTRERNVTNTHRVADQLGSAQAMGSGVGLSLGSSASTSECAVVVPLCELAVHTLCARQRPPLRRPALAERLPPPRLAAPPAHEGGRRRLPALLQGRRERLAASGYAAYAGQGRSSEVSSDTHGACATNMLREHFLRPRPHLCLQVCTRGIVSGEDGENSCLERCVSTGPVGLHLVAHVVWLGRSESGSRAIARTLRSAPDVCVRCVLTPHVERPRVGAVAFVGGLCLDSVGRLLGSGSAFDSTR